MSDNLDLPDRIENGAFDDLLVNIETACRNRRAALTEAGETIPWDDGGYDVQSLRALATGDMDTGTEPLDLDDDVHDAASNIGSDINNGGVDAQVDFLVEHLGYFAAQTLIHDRARQQR